MKRTIVITGVSKGLGRALVGEFAQAGHTVCGCARSEPAIAELAKQHPGKHRFDRVDATDDAQVADWASRLLSAGLVPDLLINNAALINRNAPLWKVPPDEMDQVLRCNVLGTYQVIRHFLPAMIEAGRGVIVNFSSTWGRSTSPEVAPYCATKWAIEGMTQSLSQELPRGLAAVALNPGIIDTDMLRSCFGDAAGSYPSPERWATTAAPFLLGLGPADNGQALTAP